MHSKTKQKKQCENRKKNYWKTLLKTKKYQKEKNEKHFSLFFTFHPFWKKESNFVEKIHEKEILKNESKKIIKKGKSIFRKDEKTKREKKKEEFHNEEKIVFRSSFLFCSFSFFCVISFCFFMFKFVFFCFRRILFLFLFLKFSNFENCIFFLGI